MRILCDTNILAGLSRPKPDEGLLRWAEGVPLFVVSVITLEEIVFGLTKKPNPRVSQWFDRFFEEWAEILPVDRCIAETAGSLRGRMAAEGQTRSQADLLIAATAEVHRLTLATRNTRDFSGCGVSIINPFSK